MAEVTVVCLLDRQEVLISQAQRVARWLEQLGETAQPCSTRGCRRPQDHSGSHYFSDQDALPAGVKTYETGCRGGQGYILCRVCGSKSFHPEDIAQRYCGRCHQFHEILQQIGRGL